MTKKVVIEVSMKDAKARSKALKIVVGVSGVEGAAIKGEDRDQIEVTGEVIDSVKLTRLLRKKFCHVNLVSVGPVEKKEEKKEKKEVPVEYWPQYYYPIMPMRCYEDPSCSIM